MCSEVSLEAEITRLLAEKEYEGHPLRAVLQALFEDYSNQLTQMERLTAISDGYQTAMREKNHTLADRYRKQIRHLQKIVRISDHYQQMLREANNALKVASTQDPLTGLPNRRLILDRIAAEVSLAARRHQPFAIALADIDLFKNINDNFGHDAGDKSLVGVAKAISQGLRAYDVCARWGGEEFLILLPETEADAAVLIAERLRHSVEEIPQTSHLLPATLTLSIGVAIHQGNDVFENTLKRADLALYQAKNSGRNRVVLAA